MPYITRAGKGGVPRFRHHKQEVYHKIAAFGKAALRTAFLLGIGFVMLYPVLFILSGAFKAKQDVYDPTVIWFPKHYSLEAMGLALDTLKFGKSVGRTLAILVPSVLLQMVSTLMAGYGFARFRFRERGILFALLIFTIIVPVQNLIVPLYANFQSFDMLGAGYLFGAVTGEGLPNLLDTNLPFYLMAAFGMGIRSGLYIFIMRQFFRNMPAELEEACRKSVRITVSDTENLPYILERGLGISDFKILSATEADIFGEAAIGELALALHAGGVELLRVRERDEDLEGYFINLVGGRR